MIKLSDRLKAIAEEINRGETMADIGTDHGFLPLYLYENRICPHVIMTDISGPSLEKARENARRLFPGEEFDFRCGSGADVLLNGEADKIVIAGMGGKLMAAILGEDIEKSRSFSSFILQPRRHAGNLRYFLLNNGFYIEKEKLVRESRFICEIIIAGSAACSCEKTEDGTYMDGSYAEKYPELKNQDEDSIMWEVPPWYVYSEEKLAEQYISRKLERELRILRSKESGNNTATNMTKSNIIYLEKVLAGFYKERQI